MRIHTDKVTRDHLTYAAADAGVELVEAVDHGSRKRDHAFEIRLSGSGVMGGMYGNAGFRTATWDEWGMFLGDLFNDDPDMLAGPYKGNREDEYESFDFLTGDRFNNLAPADQHRRHKWRHVAERSTYCFIPGLVGSYIEEQCQGCGAVRRHVSSYVKDKVDFPQGKHR